MFIDIRTLFIISVLLFGCFAITTLYLWRAHRDYFRGLGYWSLAFGVHSFAGILFSLRNYLNDFISIVVANTLIILGYTFFLEGIVLFSEQRGIRKLNYAITALIPLTFIYFTYISFNLAARIIIISVAVAYMLLFSAYKSYIKRNDELGDLYKYNTLAFAVLGLVFVSRIPVTLLIDPGSEFMKSGIYQSLSILMYVVGGVFIAVGLFLLITKRIYNIQLQEKAELGRFKFTLDQIVDCIFIFRDSDYVFTYINEGASQQVGYSHKELLRMTPLDIKPEITMETFNKIVAPLISGEKRSINFQTIHRHRDGHDIPVDIILQHDKAHWHEGRFVALVRDITDIKKTEDALNKSLLEKTALINRLDMLNRAIEAIQVGITICNNKREIIYVNEADAKMHGYTVGELLGQKTSVYKSREIFEQKPLNELKLDYGWIRESVNISMDGREFPVLLSSVYIKDDEGKPNAMVTACEDITEIKRAQEAIAKNEAFLNSILNSTDEPILVINADYEVIMMNASAKRNANSYVNLSKPAYCYQISHHNESPCESGEHKCSLKEVFESGQPFSDIHIHKNDKGEDIYVDITAAPILGGDGKVFAVVESCHDITEIIRTRDNLKQALNDKDMLIKEVHHRVKNNLSVIQSLLSLQSSQSKDQSAKYALSESQSRVRAISLIHERLYRSNDLSTLDFSDYISSLAQQIYANFCTNMQDVTIRIDIPKISVDIDTIIPCGLIVNELLTNTFKYAFPEGRKGKVVVKVEYDEVGQMFLIVRDNGVGLPDEFDISSSHSLGMKIVTSLSSQIGSDVQIRSDEHETEFKVLLLKANLKPLEWTDAHHLIGHEAIDRQHRHLYDAIERLKDAIVAGRYEEGLTELVPELIQYVGEHFKTEEDIMVEHNYPAYQSHKKAHADFVEKVTAVVSDIKAGKAGLSLSVYDFLANWLMDHMWNVDMEMAAFMKHKGLISSPEKLNAPKAQYQILFIEDDKLAQMTMSRFLQKNGYSFSTAATGTEAIKVIESNVFELIISDVMLPDMDGIETINKMRTAGVETPVLFLTGKDSNDTSEQVKGLNVLGILPKPVSFPDMKKILTEFFEK